MSDQFVGEIRIFGGNFAPSGWAMCNGDLLSIAQNTALYDVIGTTYGGDGVSTFALPNLQGSAPLGAGPGPGLTVRDIGASGGETAVALLETEMPPHTHTAQGAAASGSSADPTAAVWSTSAHVRSQVALYAASADSSMSPSAISTSGAGQPHDNMMPYLTLTFIIALQGVTPSPS